MRSFKNEFVLNYHLLKKYSSSTGIRMKKASVLHWQKAIKKVQIQMVPNAG